MWVKFLFVLVVYMVVRVEPSRDVMHKMTLNFIKPLTACKKEMDLPEEVIQDLLKFWKEGHQLEFKQSGCAIICVASKLELLEEETSLHHGNAIEFAKNHGADQVLAKKLVDIIHNCVETTPSLENDPCQKVIDVAMCFKTEIHGLDWAPNHDLLLAEFLAET